MTFGAISRARPRNVIGRPSMVAFAAYAVLSLVLIGAYALPHPTRECLCTGNAGDPPQYMWNLAWWPHAIAHGLNPFFTRSIWAPGGQNVAAAPSSIPLAAAVLSPITAAFGTIASYNLMTVLSPALSALTTFVLCRRLAGRFLPAFVGGLIFGFGSYELAELLGHPNLYLDFLVPVIPHLALRRLAHEITRTRFIILLAIVFGGQVLLSTEILFDCALVGLIALAVGYMLGDHVMRVEIRGLIRETVVAGALALVITSPYLYWSALKQPIAQFPYFAEHYKEDLLNLVTPTRTALFGGSTFGNVTDRFSAGISENGGYIGLPLLIVFGYFVYRIPSPKLRRFIAIMFAASILLALGPHLAVGGHSTTIPLPWRIVENLPLFKLPAPARFAMFTSLILAVTIALGLAATRLRLVWLATVVGLVLLIPDTPGHLWQSRPANTALMTSAAYKTYLPGRPIVLILPFSKFGYGMLWQAEADFGFRLADGYISGELPAEYRDDPDTQRLNSSARPPSPGVLARFLQAHRVTAVLIESSAAAEWEPILSRLGLTPLRVDGVLLYRVAGRN